MISRPKQKVDTNTIKQAVTKVFYFLFYTAEPTFYILKLIRVCLLQKQNHLKKELVSKLKNSNRSNSHATVYTIEKISITSLAENEKFPDKLKGKFKSEV